MTAEELIKAWAQGAKGGILYMSCEEVNDFAKRNDFDIRDIRSSESGKLIGWRLYQTCLLPDGITREPRELYYVVVMEM